MPTASSTVRAHVAARALALAVGLLGACSSEQVEPPGDDTDDPATSADPTGPVTATEPGTTTTEDPTGTTTTEGTTTDDPPDPTSTTGDPAECETRDGCWSCTPTTHKQHLNACTDATCEPFPNTKDRLPLLEEDGTLPPLP
ncbi:hypothetical protein [Nannocystis punicea]|uniref:Uncharacterized protein n=1 Tax=Nannocystis punicea TaxID=2995304 RepID=A0ABY7GXN7_9BACT|nr:hypothetical protein [Nannocystis poenicansa]WAS91640.1 hypothetical protein O0S08_36120 [Nannocystis poenicansa]